MTPTENVALTDFTDFTWKRPHVGGDHSAQWAPYVQREVIVPWHAHKTPRSQEEWQSVIDEDEVTYERNPWLWVSDTLPYQPLREYPALFREFVSMPFDRDAYAEFAGRYGALFGLHTVHLPDRLRVWVLEHHYMRRCVGIWETLRSGVQIDDVAGLGIRLGAAQYINEVPATGHVNAALSFTPDDLAAIMGWSGGVEESSWPWLIQAAWEAGDGLPTDTLVDLVHRPVPGVVVRKDSSPREIAQKVLSDAVTRALYQRGVTPTLVVDGKAYGSGLRLSYAPRTLAAALWLQLTLAIDGDRAYKACQVCGRWWDATDARSHKEVCSDKCRARKKYLKDHDGWDHENNRPLRGGENNG